MDFKQILHTVVPDKLWGSLRTRKIIARHKAVAEICERLISQSESEPLEYAEPLVGLGTDKVIWQYWAQGYDQLPEIVAECLQSVDNFKGDFQVIRLTDATVGDYIRIPDYVERNRKNMSVAHYSDILRYMLLSTYGGVWMDATIMLSGPIPDKYLNADFFMFQRNPQEENKTYWENTYAYYFCWAAGFRVNMLNSFICAKKNCNIIKELSSLLLKWWKDNASIPDYFFNQILFDVLINGKYNGQNCEIVSDTLPHYLQQSMNDPKFNLMTRDEILRMIPVHKLTYK